MNKQRDNHFKDLDELYQFLKTVNFDEEKLIINTIVTKKYRIDKIILKSKI